MHYSVLLVDPLHHHSVVPFRSPDSVGGKLAERHELDERLDEPHDYDILAVSDMCGKQVSDSPRREQRIADKDKGTGKQ